MKMSDKALWSGTTHGRKLCDPDRNYFVREIIFSYIYEHNTKQFGLHG